MAKVAQIIIYIYFFFICLGKKKSSNKSLDIYGGDTMARF